MLQLELPHVNVLSKIDLLSQFDFNLDYYTEVQDLSYLENSLPQGTKFAALNMRISELVQDFALVGFETLAVEDRESMLRLMRIVDKATGCVFVPAVSKIQQGGHQGGGNELSSTKRPNIYSLFTTAAGPIRGIRSDVRDVQERWLEAKDVWDSHEIEQRKREAQMLSRGNQ
ncbi:hypothetical protein FRC17_003990 [Serendipita sp. 399]|nr:hypothetical protein FRC17_003990 [Serendipita sp. 399]